MLSPLCSFTPRKLVALVRDSGQGAGAIPAFALGQGARPSQIVTDNGKATGVKDVLMRIRGVLEISLLCGETLDPRRTARGGHVLDAMLVLI